MRRARQMEMNLCSKPLMDVLHKPRSILTAVQQYTSLLLAGKGERLQLVWRQKYTSFNEWYDAEVEERRALRRVLVLVASSIYRRHVRSLRSWPWLLVCFADPRVDGEERRELAVLWDGCLPCCMPSGFAKKLKERGFKSEDIETNQGMRILLQWFAHMVRMQVCDVEWRHHRNRSMSHAYGQSRFHNFSSS